MDKLRSFAELKFAIFITCLNLTFSIVVLGALVYFVDDVASALVVYFDLGDTQKWAIVAKFAPAIVTALAALLVFNILSVFVCNFFSREISAALTSLIKLADAIITGEHRAAPTRWLSRQFAGLSRKLTQMRAELEKERAAKDSYHRDMETISRYLRDLDSAADTPVAPITLPTASVVAAQLNKLAAERAPAKLDRAE